MHTTHLLGVYDESGRYLGPAEVAIQSRPMGPWDTNAAPLVVICAWHPGFNPADPANAGASHGICPDCLVRVDDELAMSEAA